MKKKKKKKTYTKKNTQKQKTEVFLEHISIYLTENPLANKLLKGSRKKLQEEGFPMFKMLYATVRKAN